MNTKLLRRLWFTFSFIFVFCLTHPALAHGGEPRLEISHERINPGGVVDIRGVDFEPEELVTLTLTRSPSETALGQVTADAEGIFVQTILLPADLPEGTYTFRAVTDDHEILSPALVIAGAPVLNQEEGGQREEEELLLAPMPTPQAQPQIPVSGSPVQNPDVQAETAPTNVAPDLSPYKIFLVALTGIVITLMIGERLLRRR